MSTSVSKPWEELTLSCVVLVTLAAGYCTMLVQQIAIDWNHSAQPPWMDALRPFFVTIPLRLKNKELSFLDLILS
jgi:hypothetical protein